MAPTQANEATTSGTGQLWIRRNLLQLVLSSLSMSLSFMGQFMSPHHSITLIRCLVLMVIIVIIVLNVIIVLIVPVVIIVSVVIIVPIVVLIVIMVIIFIRPLATDSN